MASLAAAAPTGALAQEILRIAQSQSLPQEDSDLRTAMLEIVDAIIKYLEALLASKEPPDFDSYLESIIPLFVHFNQIANKIAAHTASAPEEILPEICYLENFSYDENHLGAHKQNLQLDKVFCALDLLCKILIANNDDLSKIKGNTYVFNQECCVEVKKVIEQQGGKFVVVLRFDGGIGREGAYNAKREDVEFRCRSGRLTLSTMHPNGTEGYETSHLQAVFRIVDDGSSSKYFLETCFPISLEACDNRSPPEPHKMVSDIISFQRYLFVFFKESDEDRIIKSARLLLRVFTEWMGSEPKALFE